MSASDGTNDSDSAATPTALAVETSPAYVVNPSGARPWENAMPAYSRAHVLHKPVALGGVRGRRVKRTRSRRAAAPPEKRQAQLASERGYRKELAEQINHLRELVPECREVAEGCPLHKLDVLRRTVDYLRRLQAEKGTLPKLGPSPLGQPAPAALIEHINRLTNQVREQQERLFISQRIIEELQRRATNPPPGGAPAVGAAPAGPGAAATPTSGPSPAPGDAAARGPWAEQASAGAGRPPPSFAPAWPLPAPGQPAMWNGALYDPIQAHYFASLMGAYPAGPGLRPMMPIAPTAPTAPSLAAPTPVSAQSVAPSLLSLQQAPLPQPGAAPTAAVVDAVKAPTPPAPAAVAVEAPASGGVAVADGVDAA